MTTLVQSGHMKRRFLKHFRVLGNVSAACAAAGITRRGTVYDWQEHDDAFAAAYREAEIQATEVLEAEARRRAVDGVTKETGIFHHGQLIGTQVEVSYSDTLLIFLLKARAPEKYRERHDVTTGGQPLAAAHADLDAAIERGLAGLVARSEGAHTVAGQHSPSAEPTDARR